MSKRHQRAGALVAAAAAVALLVPATMAGSTTVVQVNQTDINSATNPSGTWYLSTPAGGQGAFVHGPTHPPLGAGSFAMDTTVPNVDKVTLVTYRWFGQPLSALSGLTYWTYRSAASTSPSFIVPSVNIEVLNATGVTDGYTTLVFEPIYAFGGGAVQNDTWQRWDTTAAPSSTFSGGWWTTHTIGSCGAAACYTTLAALQALAPGATIISVGVNLGRGPASFIGNVDDLSVTMGGQTTAFNFELLSFDKAGCKHGGWADFHASPSFRNQGGCVSYFARQQGRHP